MLPHPGPRAAVDPRLLPLAAAGCSLVVLAAYCLRAWALVRYPWDWSPDEAMHLDYARRLLEAPGTLYGHSVVPFPSFYGPLLPLLLAPIVHGEAPLAAARVVNLGFGVLAAAAVGVLVARRGGWAWAFAAIALLLAPLDLSFWLVLLRVDAALLALWLWAAVALLPDALARGAGELSGRRALAGSLLLLAAVLVKPTAILHGAPLVLGWLLVDRRSALRLAVTLGAAGALTLAALQLATGGGYLWVNGLWGLHFRVPGQATAILTHFVVLAWPALLLALAGCLAARSTGARVLRDPALLLVLGGLATVPLLGKHGAGWNYLIPLYAALVLASSRWLAVAASATRSPRLPALALVGVSTVAVALAVTRVFPLPSALDERTARVFYDFTREVHGRAGGPFLVSSPDLVYFLVGQPDEIEGTSFIHLALGNAPGARGVLDGLRAGRYTLVVETWPLPPAPEWREALRAGYRHVGGCRLGWYFGAAISHVLVRRDIPIDFPAAEGTRCAPAAPVPIR